MKDEFFIGALGRLASAGLKLAGVWWVVQENKPQEQMSNIAIVVVERSISELLFKL